MGNGLVASHAYSILSAHEIVHPILGKKNLLQLRNPVDKLLF